MTAKITELEDLHLMTTQGSLCLLLLPVPILILHLPARITDPAEILSFLPILPLQVAVADAKVSTLILLRLLRLLRLLLDLGILIMIAWTADMRLQ